MAIIFADSYRQFFDFCPNLPWRDPRPICAPSINRNIIPKFR